MGDVPKGWELARLDSIVVLQRGFDLPVDRREPGTVPVFAAGGRVGTHSTARVCAPGVLTGRSGSLGGVALVFDDFWPLNTTLWAREFRVGGPLFAYYLLSTLDLRGLDGGAAVPTLNRNHVHALQVRKPPLDLVQRFEDQVEPMLLAADRLRKGTEAVSRQRDLVLPRLVSGEVPVEAIT
jgi:type I restriction enzyme S subunit